MNTILIDKAMDEFEKAKVPYCAVKVYKDHEAVYEAERGNKKESGKRFFLYSCSKVMTVTAMMRLIEQRKIGLDEPVYKYLPEYKDAYILKDGKPETVGDKMTIRHLFTMSAGLTYDFNTEPALAARAVKGATTIDIANSFIKTPLSFEPGDRFQYSLCHDVLGAVASAVTGKSFAEYMRENVFSPLGMKDTSFAYTESEMADKYVYKDGAYIPDACSNCYILGDNYHSGGAGVISTLNDFALFADALACCEGQDGYPLLKRESADLLREEQASKLYRTNNFGCAGGKEFSYGLGVHTLVYPNSETKAPLGVFGWDGAAGAYIMCDVEHKLSIAFLTHVHNWPSINKNAPFHRNLRNAVCETFLG